ncbi:MAG: nucleotidyltransferase domain-containing protein [Desulfobacterales bacterium]
MKNVTEKGTIAPNMSTINKKGNLSATLFGKTRRAVLALLYSHVDESFYLRQIFRAAGVGMGAVQRELKRLSDSGIIIKTLQGQQVYYTANPECPIYDELKSLVMKTVGIGEILKAALVPLADLINVAFLFGSLVRGDERSLSDADVLVVGDVTFSEVVTALSQVQETIRREINPVVYPPKEFRSKLSADHHFLKTTLNSPKFFLIGDEHELAKLVE